jgi:hypothetical protein
MAEKKFVETNTALRDLGIGAAAGATSAAVVIPFQKYDHLITRHILDKPKKKIPFKQLLGRAFKDTFGKDFKREYGAKFPGRAVKNAVSLGVSWAVANQLMKKLDARKRS